MKDRWIFEGNQGVLSHNDNQESVKYDCYRLLLDEARLCLGFDSVLIDTVVEC